MTRTLLAIIVCGLTLALGLATCWIQSRNHARAGELDRVKRRADFVEAENEALRADILSGLFTLERGWTARIDEAETESAEIEGAPER